MWCKVEYRAMVNVTSELLWLKHLLQDLTFHHPNPMMSMCDNQVTICTATKLFFCDRKKHIEIGFCSRVLEEVIQEMHVRSNNQLDDQLADLFSESFGGSIVKYICNKLEKYDI